MIAFLGRALAAEFLVVGSFIAAYALACRLLPNERTSLRWAGIVAAGAFLASIGFHVLAALRAFDLPCAIAAVAGLMGVVFTVGTGERSLAQWLRRDGRFLRRVTLLYRRSPHRGVVLAIMMLGLPILLRPLLLPPLGWDTLTYHGVKAAMWVQHRGDLHMDAPGPWAHYQWLWGGGEVFTAWAMLPFHGDLLAFWVDAVEWVALGLSLLAVSRELGVREPYSSATVAVALAVPSLRVLVGSGYVEICLLMTGAASLALGLRALAKPSSGTFYLAAAAAGVAASVKLPFLPIALLIVGAVAARMLATSGRSTEVAAGLAIFAMPIAPWIWQSHRNLGLPFSPLPVRVLGVDLGRASAELAWYQDRPWIPTSVDAGVLAKAFFGDMQSPGAPVVMLLLLAVVASPSIARRSPATALLLGSIVAVNFAEYAAGSLAVVRHNWPGTSVRFLLPALVLAVVAAGAFGRLHPRLGRSVLLVLWSTSFFFLLRWLPYGVSAVGGIGLLVLVVGVVLLAAVLRRTPRVVGALALIPLALAGLDVLRGRIREDLLRREFTNHDMSREWVDAAILADDPKHPKLIAVTSGPWQDIDNWLALPFMGRALQNEVFYVPVSKDGQPGHFGAASLNAEYERSADYESWKTRLRDRHVDAVMSFLPASVELGWMEAHPQDFTRLAGERGAWGYFSTTGGPS